MINNPVLPINYMIIYCTSSDPLFPIENIKKSYNIISKDNRFKENINIGWSSVRFCSYPQVIIIQLSKLYDITQINFLINHERIPSQISIYAFCPKNFLEMNISDKKIINEQFNFIGNIFPTNHKTNNRELKQVFLNEFHITNCLYLKFELYQNYIDEIRNKCNQIGLIELNIFGIDNNTPIPVINKKSYYKEEETDFTEIKGLLTDDVYENFIKDKIEFAKRLFFKKNDPLIYSDIEQLRELGRKVKGLRLEKKYHESIKDYKTAKKIHLEINEIKNYIENTYNAYGGEQILYENKNPVDITREYNQNLFVNKNKININESNLKALDNEINENFISGRSDYDYKKTKEILERRALNKKLIEESKEAARRNIQAEYLTLHNVNLNL